MIILGLIEYIAIIVGSYRLSLWYPETWIRMHIEGNQILADKFYELFSNSDKE